MKVAIGVAAAVMMFAASAAAQTSTPAAPPAANANCSGFVTPPTFPDGATANARQMTAGNEAYQTWGSQRVARLTACRADIEAMRAQLNALEQAYIAANAELNATTAAWQAEADEYNARGGGRR